MPNIGAIVHYILPADGYHWGQHRVATILALTGTTADLLVHSEGLTDGALYGAGDVPRLEVPYATDGTLGTWHQADHTPLLPNAAPAPAPAPILAPAITTAPEPDPAPEEVTRDV